MGIAAAFSLLGCGSAVVESIVTPTINAVLPQSITAGATSAVVKVTGSNFSSNAVILWNGGQLSTSQVDTQTLSASVQGSSIAVPGTAQVQVRDVSTGRSSQTVPVSIISAATNTSLPLAISSTSLPAGVAGSSYTAALTATGGISPYTWAVASGTLPAGLTLAAASGVISGAPTVSGTFAFTVSVSDSSHPTQKQTAAVSIPVAAAPVTTSPLAISSTTLAVGTSGAAYTATLTVSGGTSPYSWVLSSGTLPAGLTLSSGGVISGTPSASGTSSFTVSVHDSSSPEQTKTATLSITVAPTTLTITSGSLAAGTSGTAYTATLAATGGTSPYTWALSSGTLPAGLTLSTGGVISGTPTASGTSSFAVSVHDSSSPEQTKSVTLSISIAAPPLSVTTSWLPNGTEGTEYTSTLTASGGTSPYTWSVSSGSLPAGITLSSSTGEITGSPTTSGTFTFTVTAKDNGSPIQTASAPFKISIASSTASGPGTTWYIRPDGGTRFDANQPNGQCNGMYNAPYPGTGVDQNCAFNDFRFMWDDQSYGNDAWVMKGGDTVIIEGCAANANQISPSAPDCRIGWDSNTGPGAGQTWCFGGDGNQCINPTIPAGTATQPTRILGQNYANCSTNNTTNRSALTQLFGGFGIGEVLNLSGAQNVQIECLEITSHNQAVPGTPGICITHGSPAYPAGCSTGSPLSDFDSNGIVMNSTTSNALLQDLYIHGHTNTGIQGPIGGVITLNRVFIGFNGFAGWNFDDGSSTPDAPNSSINANYVTMEGNGCNEQYPIVNSTFPAESCYDLDSGGFGDSWSGQNTNLNSFTCNHCKQIYNTKDGFIGPHTQIANLVIENSESIGNMGQQWKWNTSPGSTTLVENTLTIGNCNRMSEQIPGAAQNFNMSTGLPGSYLSLFCRAAGDIFSFSSSANSTVLFANNTVVGYSATVFDMNCVIAGTCGTTPYDYENNIFIGYLNDDPAYANLSNQEAPGLYYYSDPTDTVTANNNLEYGIRNGDTCGENYIQCTSPLLVDEPVNPMTRETELDNFDFYPSATSPAVGAGVAIPGLTTDYYGVARPDPPTEGAVEPQE